MIGRPGGSLGKEATESATGEETSEEKLSREVKKAQSGNPAHPTRSLCINIYFV